MPLSVCLTLLTYLVAFSISIFKMGIHDQNLIIFETSVPLQNVWDLTNGKEEQMHG